jgi:GntR family transcriptional repressor for pyruvate dehydrogenase complex
MSTQQLAKPGVLERIARQDLPMETTARLAQLVAASEPGSCLPTERELCEQLGVGRSTLREAIRSLAFIGAVQPRQGSGTFVSSPEDRTFERLIGLCVTLQRAKAEEVIDLRRVLEVEAVRRAALHHDEEDRQELESIMDAMAGAAGDPAAASRYDLQFHATIARASHNAVLRTLINGMRSLLEVWINKAVTRQPIVEEIVKEHNAVLKALFARDSELAAALMTAHLGNAAERLFAVVGRDHSTASYVSLLLSGSQEV